MLHFPRLAGDRVRARIWSAVTGFRASQEGSRKSMKKRHELIDSPSMGRRMHVWCFGSWGMPLLVFPSAAGFAHEWDAQGMIDALAPLILSGKLKIYCPESNISQSWTSKGDPLEMVRKHQLYEAFIMEVLVPWIRRDCRSQKIPLATAGCSLGGFYAAIFALKFPRTFNYALCMSGRYKLSEFTGGFSNTDIYLNDPIAFVPNLRGTFLERVSRGTHLTLVCGQGAFEEGCIEETISLGQILKAKGIPHILDIWGKESRHDWTWWKRQAVGHLSRTFTA